MIGQLAKLAALGAGGAGLMAGPVKLASMTGQKKLDAKKREAEAEMKRETRGIEKPANFDAIEEAKQDAKDRAAAKMQEKAYNDSLTTEGKAKGGKIKKMANGGVTRADGIAKRGKTRGKMR